MKNKKEKKVYKKWEKALIGVGASLASIIGLVLVLVLTLNLCKFAVYKDYYAIREIVCTNHGIDDGYMSQGTAITDDGKYVITSGYMNDDSNSRIYIIDTETDTSHFVKINKPNGEKCTYHFGGVAVNDDVIYIASNNAIYTISLSEALKSDELTMVKLFDSNTEASFVFVNATHLYVGEFYLKGIYDTDHRIEFNGKQYNAIVECYELGEYTTPVLTYLIKDKVQGFAVNEKGDILLSESYGLTSSKFSLYKKIHLVDTYEIINNSGVFALETPTYEFEGPAMSEDLDYRNGKFYTNFESSCEKYVFGKFFASSNLIVALNVPTEIKL